MVKGGGAATRDLGWSQAGNGALCGCVWWHSSLQGHAAQRQ